MTDVLERFHRTLVEEIRAQRPSYLTGPFTVAEIYQNLVPYGSHRDRIGVDMNGDYEDALLRLLAGEGGYLVLDSEHAVKELREELESANPNTGLYREYAAVDVRLGRTRLPSEDDAEPAAVAGGEATSVDALAPDGPAGDAAGAEASRAEAAASASGSEDGPAGFWATPATPDSSLEERRTEPLAAPDGEEPEAPAREDAAGSCRWCRAELPDHANLNFCPFCGTDVHLLPCPSCGEEIQPDWRFCVACGTEIRT